MLRSVFLGQLFASAVRLVLAQEIIVTPSNDTSLLSSDTSNTVIAWKGSKSTNSTVSSVFPLVNGSTYSLPAAGQNGTLLLATTGNQLSIVNNDIAFLSCDPESYPGNLGADDVLLTAEHARASAILLYSTSAAFCNLSGAGDAYPYIFSTKSAEDAQAILSAIQGSNQAPNATIGNADTIDKNVPSSTSEQAPKNAFTDFPGVMDAKHTPGAGIAMIILYVITGLITALFLGIIIAGTLRAYRHPDRYGPQNVVGMPHRTRAQGLARAMLESLPIVKFGEEHSARKTEDVEMNSTQATPEPTIAAGHNAQSRPPTEDGDKDSVRSGIGPHGDTNVVSPSTKAAPIPPEGVPGCSICTDDFEAGQDVRVLPCNHKFHPACIDPWLLRVSGTCPLCRIDLNPRTSREGDTAAPTDLPPPITHDETEPRSNRSSMRRSLLLNIAGIVPMGEITTEQRLEVARQYNASRERRREEARIWRASMSSTTETLTDEERERRRRMRFSLLSHSRSSSRGGGAYEGDAEAGGRQRSNSVRRSNSVADDEREARRRRRFSQLFNIHTRSDNEDSSAAASTGPRQPTFEEFADNLLAEEREIEAEQARADNASDIDGTVSSSINGGSAPPSRPTTATQPRGPMASLYPAISPIDEGQHHDFDFPRGGIHGEHGAHELVSPLTEHGETIDRLTGSNYEPVSPVAQSDHVPSGQQHEHR